MFAQSIQPACKGSDTAMWSFCNGTANWPNGQKYVGEWKGGKPHGQGSLIYGVYVEKNKGETYFGLFKDGEFDGQGTYILSDGSKFVGEYKGGNRNGQGILYSSDGSIIIQGRWTDGLLEQSFAVDTRRFPFIPPSFPEVTQTSVPNQNVLATVVKPSSPEKVNSFSETTKYPKHQELKSSHILVESAAEAAYLYQEIQTVKSNKIAKFRELAIKFSKDPGSGKNGGQLGWAPRGTFVPEYERIADTLKVGDISMPFKTTFGWHLMYLEDKFELAQTNIISNQVNMVADSNSDKNSRQESTQVNSNERRVALVIGNATYKVNPLKNPVNDSTDMARSLRSVGFDVIEANNTTLAQMREVTRRFADKLGSSDVGLVYYSGHGVEVKGKNYLIPVNADIKREYEVIDQAFDASQFLEMMDNIRGPNNKRVNILIVDACRNNELQRSWRSTNNGLARMDAPGGTFISFATAPGRVAADGTGRNSPYTKHLLQALKQPNVPIEQVFKVVRRNVMEETKGEQIPWENSSLVGDFYFTVQR